MTAAVHGRADLSAWREQLCQSFFRLDVESMGPSGVLSGRMSDATKGRVHAVTVDVRGEPHRVRRVRSKTEDGGLLVSVQLQGGCVVRQGDREAVLRPGDMAVYDAGRPYDLVFPSGDHRQAVLQVPVIDSSAASMLLGQTAVRIPGEGGIGPAVGALLTAIPTAIQDAETVHAERLAQSALELLALAVPATSKLDRGTELLHRARAFIEAHADDPELRPSTIAEGLHLSLAHLHRTFRQSDNTVGALVKQVRLERAAADLRDEKLGRWTVAEIATRRGFSDSAHFSRSFAAHFGMSPSEWRRRGA